MATTTTRRRPSQPGGTGRWAATAARRWVAVTLLTAVYYFAWAVLVVAEVSIGFALFSDGSSLQTSGRWVSVALVAPSAIFNFIVFPTSSASSGAATASPAPFPLVPVVRVETAYNDRICRPPPFSRLPPHKERA